MWLRLAMKRGEIAEPKDHLSRYLREVERGAEVEVTDRATALLVRPVFEDLALATHDRELTTAARSMGFRVHGVAP
ncbi:MAG: hypothetical protein KatS3mg013_1086 [Actinomycetota bacterium]|nr:MAG: hypothetical protein KatS3mg013_1086 [Actinomycetota bacterium]